MYFLFMKMLEKVGAQSWLHCKYLTKSMLMLWNRFFSSRISWGFFSLLSHTKISNLETAVEDAFRQLSVIMKKLQSSQDLTYSIDLIPYAGYMKLATKGRDRSAEPGYVLFLCRYYQPFSLLLAHHESQHPSSLSLLYLAPLDNPLKKTTLVPCPSHDTIIDT